MSIKYRKKPVVIEAIKFTGENTNELIVWSDLKVFEYRGDGKAIGIHTLEGDMCAMAGDYIIKGVKGEFYSCKPDIFEMTYEETND